MISNNENALSEIIHPEMIRLKDLLNRDWDSTSHIAAMAEHMGKFIGMINISPPNQIQALYHLRMMIGHGCAAYYLRWFLKGGFVTNRDALCKVAFPE